MSIHNIKHAQKIAGELEVMKKLQQDGLVKTGEVNLSNDELAELFVTSMLEDGVLNKADLLVKAKAWMKSFSVLRSIPKDYNAMPKKNVNAQRLRTIEIKDAEAKFWHNLVKEIDPDNMEKYYKQQRAMRVARGFEDV
jgi:hypothetical protein